MEATPAARALPFPTLFNFRDIGGYRTVDGRTVRRRRVFRADSLHRLTASDRAAFAELGIRTVLDLRRPHEITRDGRVPEYDGLGYRHIHPEHRDWRETPHDGQASLARYLADRYRDLAEEGATGLAAAVDVIADERSAPVVVHCVAGKDRTGVVCALTLSLLGVPDADIADDYALSTEASERFTAFLAEQYPDVPPVPPAYMASPAEAMLLFLAELRARHTSIERYLTQAGLNPDKIEALRTHLLT